MAAGADVGIDLVAALQLLLVERAEEAVEAPALGMDGRMRDRVGRHDSDRGEAGERRHDPENNATLRHHAFSIDLAVACATVLPPPSTGLLIDSGTWRGV